MKDFLLLITKQNLQNKKKLLSYFLPIGLCIIFLIIEVRISYVSQEISRIKIYQKPLNITLHKYPFLKTVLGRDTNSSDKKNKDDTNSLNAQAAIILDNDSKVILLEKNPSLQFSMASTTKIMTALTALDFYNLDDVLTIKEDHTEGAVVGLKKGEKLFFKDILYGMLLPSGNDAALAIAQNYPGGEKTFVEAMNVKAQALHLQNTHFADPTGLDDSNITTVIDLSRLAAEAIKNPLFSQVVDTQYWRLQSINTKSVYAVHNLNKLLGIEGVTGIKTGYTEEAGEVLVTSKTEAGHTLIIVVMKSEDRFADTQKLLDFVSGNISYKDIVPSY